MIIPVGYSQLTFRYLPSSLIPNGADVTLGIKNTPNDLPATIAASAGAHWAATILTIQSSSIELFEVVCKNGPNHDGPEAAVPFSVVGSVSGVPLPGQTAALVNKTTALGGRHGRGRMYLPGLGDSATTDGSHLTTSAITGINAQLLTFFSEMVTDTYNPYLLHSDATAPTAIGVFIVQALLATQRRRLRG